MNNSRKKALIIKKKFVVGKPNASYYEEILTLPQPKQIHLARIAGNHNI